MKIKQLLVLGVAVTLISCGKNAITSTKVKSDLDSLSYAIGVNVYNSFIQDSTVLNASVVAKAMLDAEAGKAFMDNNQAQNYFYTYMNKKQQANLEKEAELNKIRYKSLKEQGDSFLLKNRENPGIIVTESGLQYKVVKMGTGAKPTPGDMVKVHYTGTLIDGTKFDSSVDRGEPAEFQVEGVIKGWVEALQLMPVGSKFMLYIPEDLAYGANGAGGVIKPFSTLIFEVELLEIVKQ
jgi:FKBP-type peptidyl-prolyl cis-trans isomerase